MPERKNAAHDGSTVNRRRLLATGAAATAAAATTIRFGATAGAQASATPGASPAASPAGDGVLVSSNETVPNAYTSYPEPFASTEGTPGSGGKVTFLTLSYAPPPTDHDKNDYWKGLEERLGVQWDAQIVPIDGYNERIATVFASGDLPDLFYVLPSTTRPMIYDGIRQGAFFDLTDIVESDEIKKYPNLAAFPKYMWDATKVDGRIFGVPKPVLKNNDASFYRKDWGDTLGLGIDDASTTHDLLVGMSKKDPDGNKKNDTYGLVPYGDWNGYLFNQLFSVPNGWRLNDDGTLTAALESDEYRQTLEYLASLWKDGAYHPDSATITVQDSTDLIKSGRGGMSSNGFAAVYGSTGFRSTVKEAVPDAEILPFVWPGGVTYPGLGIFGYTCISAEADDSKVDELLKIMNYLSAPFGSEEFTFLKYGEIGKQSEELPEGGYQTTDAGRAEIGNLVYPFLSENYFFYPGVDGEAEFAQKMNEAQAEAALPNPVLGIVTDTMIEKGTVVGQVVTDAYGNFVTGRESLDKLDDVIKEWQSRGGDQIRKELEDALKQQS